MTIPAALSASALRLGHSPISELMALALANPGLISLAAGFVDHSSLPVSSTARVSAEMLEHLAEGRRSLQYGTTRGDKSLRRKLLGFLEKDEGVEPGSFDPFFERMLVTTGSQQLLYLVAEALLDPEDIVLVESPTYFVFLGVLERFGARVIGVDIDQDGMRIDSLEARLKELEDQGKLGRVKLIYTVSEHSNPTGLSLSSERRQKLVQVAQNWSRKHRIFILEDAAYRGLTYEGQEKPSVWSFDTQQETVILARTFSKTYSPGLKIGFGIIPESLTETLHTLKGNHDFGSCHYTQQLLERVVSEGDYEKQIKIFRSVYSQKLAVMLKALEEYFGEALPEVRWTVPRGGLYVWLSMPTHLDTGRYSSFFKRCVDEGVIYVPGEYAYAEGPTPPPRSDLRLSFGVTTEDGIREGIRRMSLAFECVR